MANLVYKRVSTDQQSTDRQNLVLDEAGIEAPVVFEEQAGTSSRLHPLERPKFGELLAYARPGDAVHISEMFRLVRGTGHILDVLDVLHRDRLALRIHDGAFSAMDLTARHPRTGELRLTTRVSALERHLRQAEGAVVVDLDSDREASCEASVSPSRRGSLPRKFSSPRTSAMSSSYGSPTTSRHGRHWPGTAPPSAMPQPYWPPRQPATRAASRPSRRSPRPPPRPRQARNGSGDWHRALRVPRPSSPRTTPGVRSPPSSSRPANVPAPSCGYACAAGCPTHSPAPTCCPCGSRRHSVPWLPHAARRNGWRLPWMSWPTG